MTVASVIFDARLVQLARIKVERSAISPSLMDGLTPRPGMKAWGVKVFPLIRIGPVKP